MLYSTYVLKSLRNGKRYVGSTALDSQERLKKHNARSNKFSKRNKPFILVHQEKYATLKEARQRENFLKSGVGRKFFDNLLTKL